MSIGLSLLIVSCVSIAMSYLARSRRADSEISANNTASSAAAAAPLWNAQDCAVELLAWPDPLLDGTAAFAFLRKPARSNGLDRSKEGFVAPKGTWLWSIRPQRRTLVRAEHMPAKESAESRSAVIPMTRPREEKATAMGAKTAVKSPRHELSFEDSTDSETLLAS